MNSHKRCSWLLCLLSTLFFVLSLFPFTAFAWNATGHMVVASIAYRQLTPTAREKVDSLVTALNSEYSKMQTFEDMAYWPDSIRGQRIETYTHWHYINLPYAADDTTPEYKIDTDNAVWAMKMIRLVVKNNRANPYERARFLSFITHITGDLHQPLHAVSLFSTNHPAGDRGGNLYKVRYKNKMVHMHKVWDEGVGSFAGSRADSQKANEIADSIMQLYPKSSFSKKSLNDLDPEHWAQEGLKLAKKSVYNTPENQPVSTSYVQHGSRAAERQAALAGYRLGNLLNSLLQ